MVATVLTIYYFKRDHASGGIACTHYYKCFGGFRA